MTILSAQSIRRRAHGFYPMIAPFQEREKLVNGLTRGLGPASYDVTFDMQKTWKTEQRFYLLTPGFHLLSTREYLHMPNDIQAVVHDKSTWARRGIAVQNTIIDPGFRGFVTLEVTNHTDDLRKIENGDPIAQFVFHKLDYETEAPYVGKYQDQESGPQEAR